MKTSLIFSFLGTLALISARAHAALDMKPGLWEIQTTIESEGKKMDPAAEMQKAMAKMSPEQRKQMEAAMKQSGMEIGGNQAKICYTKEDLEVDEKLMGSDRGCKSNFKTKTSKKLVGDVTCEDGSKGNFEWTVKDPSRYDGIVEMTKAGKKTKMTYVGKFVSADCGKVKPINEKLPKKK